MNARELVGGWDVALIHDPQPAALHTLVPEKARGWVWRCHIDMSSTPNPATMGQLLPYIATYPQSLFHVRDYVPAGMGGARQHRPAGDRPAGAEEHGAVARGRGLRLRAVRHRRRPPDDDCQVSRFDPWKDPLGVIDAYRIVKEQIPSVQLALVGSMASDDPEGWDFFNATVAHADGDPDIHILNNFNNVGSIEVNAFQSQSDVLIQKSTREGFGLTVTEAHLEGPAVHRRQRRRHPAAGRGRRERLPRRQRRGVRGAHARDPARPRAGQGARARAARSTSASTSSRRATCATT